MRVSASDGERAELRTARCSAQCSASPCQVLVVRPAGLLARPVVTVSSVSSYHSYSRIPSCMVMFSSPAFGGNYFSGFFLSTSFSFSLHFAGCFLPGCLMSTPLSRTPLVCPNDYQTSSPGSPVDTLNLITCLVPPFPFVAVSFHLMAIPVVQAQNFSHACLVSLKSHVQSIRKTCRPYLYNLFRI